MCLCDEDELLVLCADRYFERREKVKECAGNLFGSERYVKRAFRTFCAGLQGDQLVPIAPANFGWGMNQKTPALSSKKKEVSSLRITTT